MKQKISGFIRIDTFENRTPNDISPIGELSPTIETFTKDKRRWHSSNNGYVELVVFHAQDDNGVFVTEEKAHVDEILVVLNWLHNYLTANTSVTNVATMLTALKADNDTIRKAVSEEMVIVKDAFWPDKLFLETDNWTADLWLAGNKFEDEYLLHEYTVVIPTLNIDVLLKPFDEIKDQFQNISEGHFLTEAYPKYGALPPTRVDIKTFDWFDQNDNTKKLRVPFVVATYGKAGLTDAKLNNAIVDEIKKYTTGTDQQWQTAIPDLFSPMEFYVSPAWWAVAIPGDELSEDIYSPLVKDDEYKPSLKQMAPGETDVHLDTHLTVMPFFYKSMALGGFGKETNRSREYTFKDIFPKYILVTLNGNDLDRMPPATQNFVRLMHDMLYEADTYTRGKSVPTNMFVNVRDDVHYIVSNFYGVNFYVMPRREYDLKFVNPVS